MSVSTDGTAAQASLWIVDRAYLVAGMRSRCLSRSAGSSRVIGEAVCHGCELECTSSSVLQIGRSGVPQRPGCRAGMVYGRSALLAAPRTVMGRLCNLLHLTSINFW